MSEKFKVTLKSGLVDGKRFGAGRVVITLGNVPMDGIALMAGDDRWVTTEDQAHAWLVDHGMPADKATELLAALDDEDELSRAVGEILNDPNLAEDIAEVMRKLGHVWGDPGTIPTVDDVRLTIKELCEELVATLRADPENQVHEVSTGRITATYRSFGDVNVVSVYYSAAEVMRKFPR